MLAVIPFFLLALTAGVSAAPHARRTLSRRANKWATQCKHDFAYSWDDGPYAWHGDINNAFNSVEGHTTFFLNGNNWGCIYSEANVAALQASFNAGHQIAHHTWSHPFLTQITHEEIDIEIQRLNEAFVKILGVKPKFLRPPYGDINDETAEYIEQNYGIKIVTWDIDSGDTGNDALTEEAQYAFYEGLSHDGPDVPHMPLSHETKSWSLEALGNGTAQILHDAGIKLVTVAECLDEDPYEIVTGHFGTRDATWTCDGVFVPTPVGSLPSNTASASDSGSTSASQTVSTLPTTTSTPTCDQTYISQASDNCDSIGTRFGLTGAQILAANPFLTCNDIWSYTPICIPPGGSAASTSSTASEPSSSASCVGTYTAQQGDTCDSIGSKYSVSGAAILAANPFLNCNDIWAYTPICLPPGSDSTPKTPTCVQTYTSQAGDTCASIAQQFTISPSAIQQANPFLNCADIWAFTPICVPAGSPLTPAPPLPTPTTPTAPACRETYTSVAGDTCASIGSKFALSADAIQTANTFLNCSDIWAYTPVCIPPAGAATTSQCTKTIISAAGDTCDSIGQAHNTNGAQILAWNSFLNCSDIWANTPVCVQH